MVLSTDMAMHFPQVNEIKVRVDIASKLRCKKFKFAGIGILILNFCVGIKTKNFYPLRSVSFFNVGMGI